jgi:hypothetical protein
MKYPKNFSVGKKALKPTYDCGESHKWIYCISAYHSLKYRGTGLPEAVNVAAKKQAIF